MPEGVDVTVEDGDAVIEFTDPTKRSPGLFALLQIGTPPELIEKTTGRGRVRYRVPEGNARAAGLIDDPAHVSEREKPAKPVNDDPATPAPAPRARKRPVKKTGL